MSPLKRRTKYDLKLFLASPRDVEEERELVTTAVDKLIAEERFQQQFTIDIVAWDRDGKQVAMHAAQSPQLTIAEKLRQPRHCDLVVTILWSRMGTPLPANLVKENGDPYLSGTEWEFLNALEGYRDNPDLAIWLYHRTEEPKIGMEDPEFDRKRAQWLTVKEFLSSLENADGSIQHGVNNYPHAEAFGKVFEAHLRRYLDGVLADTGSTAPTEIADVVGLSVNAEQLKAKLTANEAIDGDLLEAVYHEQPASIEAYRLCRYAAWSRDHEPLDKRFVNLHLLVDHGIKQQPRMEQTEKRYDDLQQLLQENIRHPAWVLIGDPGCGKSTVLQHYELSLARQGIGEDCDELCIWQRLSEYSIDDEPPAQWQAAAAGTNGRRWPWGVEPPGKRMPEPTWFNAHPAHLRKTSPVGVFPQSDTPAVSAGAVLCDMGGNVLEWCSSDYSNPLDPVKASTTSAAGGVRVLRGGSFRSPAVDARCAGRNGDAPGNRNVSTGFRLARGQ